MEKKIEQEYNVNVRRIVREDTFIKVKASSPEEARKLAEDAAVNISQTGWDCYDCKYWTDDDAAELVK